MEHCFTLEHESVMDVALPVSQSYIESTSISVHESDFIKPGASLHSLVNKLYTVEQIGKKD